MSAQIKVEIDGIKYHLGLGFLNELVNGTGLDLDILALESNITLLPKLVFYSRLYACKRNNLPLDFTQEDIYDYIDEKGGIAGKFSVEFLKLYTAAMMQDVPEDESKKKVSQAKK